MAYEQKYGQGILFINDKKGNDKAPDRKGNITIDGVKYDLAGWIKEGKKGAFLSLKASLPREKSEEKPKQEPQYSDEDQQIPF